MFINRLFYPFFCMKIFRSFLFVFAVFTAFFFAFQNHEARKVVYFYSGFFGLEDKKEDLFLYGQNLSDLCRKKGFLLKVVNSLKQVQRKDLYKLVIFDLEGFSLKTLRQYPSKRLVLFLWEPPSTVPKNYKVKYHRYFSKIYTWNDKLVDNRKYFKFYYPEKKEMVLDFLPFSQKELLAMIARYKHSEHADALYQKREEAVKFFEGKKGFSLFGPGWDPKYQNYLGPVPSKAVLKKFKFCLCYENMQNISGYVTEKIFDAFHYGSVPVYLGAENIDQYIPANCFIDLRQFASLEDLASHLQNMPKQDYEQYLQNIRSFLKSEKALFFQPENFAKSFEKALFE